MTTHVKLKARLGVCIAALALAATSACGGGGGSDDQGDKAPIQVLLVPPSSGPLAEYGADSVEGWEYAVKQVNDDGGLLGRKVELVKKDTDASPTTTLRVVQQAVQQDKVPFVGAVMTSTENIALNAKVEQLGVLSMNSLGGTDELTSVNCSKNTFQVVQTNGMTVNAIADQLPNIDGDNWAILASDYSFGHSAAEAFEKAAVSHGKKVVTQLFSPQGTSDFGSYITKLRNSGADALFVVVAGSDAVSFYNQADQFGLTESMKSLVSINSITALTLPALGKKVMGAYTNMNYNPGLDNETNKAFVEGFKKQFGKDPYYVPAQAYMAAEVLFEGIRMAKSADPQSVRKALSGSEVETIMGQVHVRAEDNQVLMPTWFGQVVEGDSGPDFKVLAEVSAESTSPSASSKCVH